MQPRIRRPLSPQGLEFDGVMVMKTFPGGPAQQAGSSVAPRTGVSGMGSVSLPASSRYSPTTVSAAERDNLRAQLLLRRGGQGRSPKVILANRPA